MRKPRLALVALLALVSLAAAGCGRLAAARAGTASSPSGEAPPVDLQATDWDHPFQGKGVQVGSFDEASNDVSFQLRLPNRLGDATAIYVTPAPPDSAAVAFLFDSQDFGRVIVTESAPDIPDADQRTKAYEDRVANNGQPDVWTTSEIVTIKDNITAVVGTSQYYSATIEWVDDTDVQFDVIGPQLTGDQAIQLGDLV
jgi:hypothetical protein